MFRKSVYLASLVWVLGGVSAQAATVDLNAGVVAWWPFNEGTGTIAHDGSGKAPIDPQKMMLGPCRGGAVRLAPAGDALMLGEGIETCLAAMQATGHPTWAALSASGLLALDLPPHVRDVIVLADGDEAGKAAARGAALRWKREGRRVRIAHPPEGMDFNDMLLGRAPSIEGSM